jgi:hypothetical protein
VTYGFGCRRRCHTLTWPSLHIPLNPLMACWPRHCGEIVAAANIAQRTCQIPVADLSNMAASIFLMKAGSVQSASAGGCRSRLNHARVPTARQKTWEMKVKGEDRTRSYSRSARPRDFGPMYLSRTRFGRVCRMISRAPDT